MPTYEYECEKCKRVFEVDQKISDPKLASCPLPDARSVDERFREFNGSGGAVSWNLLPFSEHPDRCACQVDDPSPHRHYTDNKKCARCECTGYAPALTATCGGPVRRLISGSTSFVLKGTGWFRDGY